MSKTTKATDLLGRVIGGWTLKTCLGEGAYSFVFGATQGDSEAVVRVFRGEGAGGPTEPGAEALIWRRMKLVGKSHPNLATVRDGGSDQGYAYLVTDLVPGRPLTEVRSSVPRGQVRPLITQIAGAARFLEDNNLVNRDLRPDNVFIDDKFERAVVLDPRHNAPSADWHRVRYTPRISRNGPLQPARAPRNGRR